MSDIKDAQAGLRKRILNGQLMPAQEKFCRLMAEGLSQTKAYVAAYGVTPQSAKVSAYRLLQKPEIRMAVARFKEEIGRRNQVTQDEIIEHLRKIRDEAFEQGKFDAAARATVALGQYLGMFREKVDVNMRDHNPFKVGTAEETKDRLKMIAGQNVVNISKKDK